MFVRYWYTITSNSLFLVGIMFLATVRFLLVYGNWQQFGSCRYIVPGNRSFLVGIQVLVLVCCWYTVSGNSSFVAGIQFLKTVDSFVRT